MTMRDKMAPEDVIAAAGRVVGHGTPAKDLTAIVTGYSKV